MSQLSYASPVAMPIVENAIDDYRTYRPNRKWLVSVLVNGKRYYFGTVKQYISQLTFCNAAILSTSITAALAYESYTQAHHQAGVYLTEEYFCEVSETGCGKRASAKQVKLMLGLDITPRVKIEIGMVEATQEEPSWKTHAFKPIDWHAQYWADL
jgi:hypothetical protein